MVDFDSAAGLAPVSIIERNDYQDALHCTQITYTSGLIVNSVPYHFECVGWQVDWRDVGPRYPRFGPDEKVWAGVIDASSTIEPTFPRVYLEGAIRDITIGITIATLIVLNAF